MMKHVEERQRVQKIDFPENETVAIEYVFGSGATLTLGDLLDPIL